MRQSVGRLVPRALKEMVTSSKPYEMHAAEALASSSKRLDICSAQLAHSFHLSGCPSLSGRTCLEIGSGWVLTHAIVCHLLGAKRIVATDLAAHARPRVLRTAIHESVASAVRDVLSPFEDHSLIRKRLDDLLRIRHFDLDVLGRIGIEYIAPLDFAREELGVPVDFVFSNSVLEHVPCEDVPLLLKNVAADLRPGGIMIHHIHLEDHRDIAMDPFGFLSVPRGQYTRPIQSSRGNRIRRSVWREHFRDIEDTESRFIYQWVRRDRELPAHVDESIRHEDPDDLRSSHIGICTLKRPGQRADESLHLCPARRGGG